MSNTMFVATYAACQEITKTFDMVWALDAGLWNLRNVTKKYYLDHPDATVEEVRLNLTPGMSIHGLNPKRITFELTWDYEEQYIAKLLLINGTAIFDTWVDDFVDATISSGVLQQNLPGKYHTVGNKIKADFKAGTFKTYEDYLNLEPTSSLSGCFHYTAHKQDPYLDNLRLIYRYFKSCRNCCAHGDACFTSAAETRYNAIKLLTASDCRINEFPKIAPTAKGSPFTLYLRGVVAFYDILIRIMNHFDLLAADYISVENELQRRLSTIPQIQLPGLPEKRNRTLRNYIKSVNMCPPYKNKTDPVYNLLKSNNIVK